MTRVRCGKTASKLQTTLGAQWFIIGWPQQAELIPCVGLNGEGLKIDLSPPVSARRGTSMTRIHRPLLLGFDLPLIQRIHSMDQRLE